MTNSVLCAVDVSDGDDDAITLKTAARLAQLDGASLDVVAVLPSYGFSQVADRFEQGFHEKQVAHTSEQLHDLTAKILGADHDGLAIRHVVATGRVYEEVLKLAKQIEPILIVVGAHKTDLPDFLLGPNASRIVRHSTCSVYVVRQ